MNGLPFFPSYECETRGSVSVCWFLKDFSQSRFNKDRKVTGSNACTIIAVLIGAKCSLHNIATGSSDLSVPFITAIAESILEGNEIHEKLRDTGKLKNINLTVPEAINALGSVGRLITEWRCSVYMDDLYSTLFPNMRSRLLEWYSSPESLLYPNLFIVTISDQRTVLFIIQSHFDQVSLIDTHQHLSHGVVVARVNRNKLKYLCYWYNEMLSACFDSRPNCYELSFLYMKTKK